MSKLSQKRGDQWPHATASGMGSRTFQEGEEGGWLMGAAVSLVEESQSLCSLICVFTESPTVYWGERGTQPTADTSQSSGIRHTVENDKHYKMSQCQLRELIAGQVENYVIRVEGGDAVLED